MLETDLTRLFSIEAAAEQPAAQISIPAARHTARIRRSWHRIIVVATPVMAAGAVVAIVAGAALLNGGPAAPLNVPVPAVAHLAAQGPGFDPMRLYASFGWLPAGTTVSNGATSRTMDWIDAEGPSISTLFVHQPGLCELQRVSASSETTELNCSDNSPTGGYPEFVVGRAPDIGGRPAYWADSNAGKFLIWLDSSRGWAVLQYFSSCSASRLPRGAEVIQLPKKEHARCISSSTLVNVARHATVGTPVGSLVFPAVLNRVPKGWQVATTFFTVQHDQLLANYLQVTAGRIAMSPNAGPPDNTPVLTVMPISEEKSTNTYCTASIAFPGGHPRHEIINGYQVLTGTAPTPLPPTRQVCAPDADGLVVFVRQNGAHPKLSVNALFSRLHLLGTDPANWTTRPIS